MTDYRKGKAAAREYAIAWQEYAANVSVTWLEYVNAIDHLERLAKRFGLIREFRENGLI